MNWEQEKEVLEQEIRRLSKALAMAEQKIKELTALVEQNSRNSNWSPSRDKSRSKRRNTSLRQKSGKKPGGQAGHVGQTLEMREKPDEIEVHRPSQCEHCERPFGENQRRVAVDRRQVHDLPPVRLVVHEHQAESLLCETCGKLTRGEFPGDVKAPVQYGAGVQQLAVYLKTEQFIPYDRSRRLCQIECVNEMGTSKKANER